MQRNVALTLISAALVALAGCATQQGTPAATDADKTNAPDTAKPTPPTTSGTPDDHGNKTTDGEDAKHETNETKDGDGDVHAALKSAARAAATLRATTENGTVNASLGTVDFYEVAGEVYVHAKVKGLDAGEHGVHVHAVGDCGATTSETGVKTPGGRAGGHFNPTNASHGMHAGDLGNLLAGADGNGTFVGASSAITLAPGLPNTITGLSVIVHANKDDGVNITSAGPRKACGIIEALPLVEATSVHVAKAEIHAVNATGVGASKGHANFVQVGSKVFVVLDTVNLTVGKHGVHVHQNGNCSATQAGNATVAAGAAGGHFNPTNASHGMHAGDLGNLVAGADGKAVFVTTSDLISLVEGAANGILGRSIVIHAGEDDLKDVASAGPRVQCGVVKAAIDAHAH